MMSQPWLDPDALPFKLDLAGERLLFVRLTAAQRAEAAFLDERALPPRPDAVWCPLSLLPEDGAASARPLDAIFHIGHCGSTLLSRLLESWPALQVLREPLPLRTLADARMPDAALLRTLLRLWARPQPPAARVLAKATSSCNGLIAPILEDDARSRAILLDMPLPSYLATILKSDASLADVRAAAPGRARALEALGGEAVDLAALAPPQLCAMGWLAERLRFDALAAGAHGARILRVDFEQLLARPDESLAAIAAHLGLDPAGLDAARTSPAWHRYSKATAHGYGRADRDHDLALARRRFAPQIEEGLRWAERFLARHPRLAEGSPR